MTARRPGARPLLVLLLALTVAVLVAGGSAPATARPPQGAPNGTTTDASPGITVRAQDYEVPADGDFRVFLDIADAPANAQVAVEIYRRIDTIDDLAASTTLKPNGLLANFDPFAVADHPVEEQTTAFTIYLYQPGEPLPRDVPRPWVKQLDEPGVYPVKIKLWDADGSELTSIVTYLVRRPAVGQAVTPADVALLTTVHQPPAIPDPDAEKAQPVTPDYRRRLDAVLDVLADQPVLPTTFVVTPETATRLRDDPEATDTLAALVREVGRDTGALVGGPFVDVDPAALVANDLGDELTRQAELGQATLQLTVATPDATTWVVDHPMDTAAIDALQHLGVTRLVLPSSTLADDQVAGPVLLPSGSGTVEALTTGFFDLSGTGPEDPVLAGHQLFARLAATASINRGPAGLAVRIDPATADAVQLETFLTGLTEPATFLRPTDLDRLFRDVPAPGTPVALVPADQPDLGRYPDQLRHTRRLLASWQSMVPDRPELGQALQVPLAVSASADLSVADRRQALRAVEDELGSRFAAISVPAEDRVTLGARDARFPLPITSKLDVPVKVVISLEASDRLSFPDPTIEATITAERTLVQIPVRTRATGDTPLRIVVRTPDGGVVLAESRYRVRSTAVSGVGVLLTIGAGGFLALWWGRHWVRTRRSRRGRHHRAGRAARTEVPDTDFVGEDPAAGGGPPP